MITVMLRGHSEIKAGIGPVTVLKHQEGRCFYCQNPLMPLGHKNCTRDHLFPSSAGFTLRGNCVMSCGKCNRRKGHKMPTINELQRAYDLIYKHHDPDKFVVHVRNGKPVIRLTEASEVEYVRDHHNKLRRKKKRRKIKELSELSIQTLTNSINASIIQELNKQRKSAKA